MIVHIPHSQIYPYNLTDEIGKMTDLYTDDLFSYQNSLIFPFSRLICDVERFVNDPMESKGMGICYTKKSDGSKLREFNLKDKERVIEHLYKPHHKKLEQMVSKEIKEKGFCLIIDGHSFSKTPLPYEDCSERPDICIGTNEHTPKELEQKALKYFENLGYSVMLNVPFAGAIVPLKYYQKDFRVKALMIEVNRGLYLNPDLTKSDNYEIVKKHLQAFLMLCQTEEFTQ